MAKVIDLGKMHVQGAFEKEGVSTPPRRLIPNEIVRCDTSKFENGCGVVQARHSISPEILYRNYWYESGVSQTMREHLANIANKGAAFMFLANQPNLDNETATGKTIKQAKILDIACNDGTLMREFQKLGARSVWGIDPSDIAGQQKDLTIINECYPHPEAKKLGQFDVITTIACFYDVSKPVEFAQAIESQLHDNGVWLFEVAYWPAMMKNLAYDQILGEHVMHYSLSGLEAVCAAAGLKIVFATETDTNGGSILCAAAKNSCDKFESLGEANEEIKEIRLKEFDLCLDEEEVYEKFRISVRRHGDLLKRLVYSIHDKEETIHILGASTKLNTILGFTNIGPDLIPFAAERSPDKHGAKTLSGIQIVSEEESRAMKPNYYLVGPYHFKKEILEREKEYLEAGGRLIFSLPELEIYDKEGKIEYSFDRTSKFGISLKEVNGRLKEFFDANE